jgi:hypothetical protein
MTCSSTDDPISPFEGNAPAKRGVCNPGQDVVKGRYRDGRFHGSEVAVSWDKEIPYGV